jgi:penicillin-binding protein 1A
LLVACARILRRLLAVAGVFGVCVVALIGAAVYRDALRDLPPVASLDGVRLPAVAVVFAADGTPLAEFFSDRRYLLDPDDIPPLLRNAFLAAEDDGFYDHGGADLIGVARAFVRNLSAGRAIQGGSTITQQVVKTMLLTPERSYQRKLRELLLAVRLENVLSKDEILALYLNEIYFGGGAYGVAAASRLYFGKRVEDLKLEEAAMLAGIPKAPSRHNPFTNWPAARRRQRYVLRRMHSEGFISHAQYRRALNTPLDLAGPPPRIMRAPYFVEEVRRVLERRYGRPALYGLGLRIHTTLDLNVQEEAERAVREGLHEVARRHDGYRGALREMQPAERDAYLREQNRALRRSGLQEDRVYSAVVTFIRESGARVHIGPISAEMVTSDDGARLELNDIVRARVIDAKREPPLCELIPDSPLQGALVAMEPESGYVRALVGGVDFDQSQFNRATQASRQPGSALKPFVYAAALERRFTPASVIVDSPVSFYDRGRWWTPKNYEKRYFGATTLGSALTHSRNVVTVKLAQRIGVRNLVDVLADFGFADLLPNLSIALGSIGTSPLELAAAYATFANGGRRPEPIFVTRVTDANGLPLDEIIPTSTQVISPATAYQITRVLQDVIRSGTGRRAQGLAQPSAGKTGTTNDARDAWFVGYTPSLVASVWVGFDRYQPLGKGETGGRVAAPIWKAFMEEATASMPPEIFLKPEGVHCHYMHPRTGRLAVSGGPSQLFCFKEGEGPTRRAAPLAPAAPVAAPAPQNVASAVLPTSARWHLASTGPR